MWPTIDQASVVPNVVVMHNEGRFFQFKGHQHVNINPQGFELNYNAQPLMLGKVVDNFTLNDANINLCPY